MTFLRRGNKFRAKKVVIDNVMFDSKKEGRYYTDIIKPRMLAMEISDLVFHPGYEITINGIHICVVKLDFRFCDHRDNRTRHIDVKGFDTSESRLRRKLVQAMHGIQVEVIL